MGERAVPENALRWVMGRHTGLSSKAIWAHMIGVRHYDGWNHPYDPADLSRCIRLMREVPEWAPRLQEMASRSHEWARLVGAWPEIEACMDAEVGWDWSKGRSAPKTYALMKAVLAGEGLGQRADAQAARKYHGEFANLGLASSPLHGESGR